MRLRLIKTTVALVGLAGLLGSGSFALADPIGPTCTGFNDPQDTCFGTIYTLTSNFVDVGSSAITDTFDIVLEVDATGTAKTGLDAVAIKVASNANWVSGALLSSTRQGSAVSLGWVEVPGGLNASGCDGVVSGFDCAHGSTLGVGTSADVYFFVFQETVKAGTIFTGAGQASVKAQFEPNGLTSEPITLQRCELPEGCGPKKVPEPGTLALLGVLGVGFGFLRLRKSA